MKARLKKMIRQWLIWLELPLTKNLAYDIWTGKILRKILTSNSNCIDIGAHKGEILDEFLTLAPHGKHFAFEPIPFLYEALKSKYLGNAIIYPFALGEKSGSATFNLVDDDPAYSGLQKRQYKNQDAKVTNIDVEVRQLDTVMQDRNCRIDLIKIDVEGGELGVLNGAKQLLTNDKPVIIFECGLGASEYYGTTPYAVFHYFQAINYHLYRLNDFLEEKKHMSEAEFAQVFSERSDYYFVAKFDR